MGRTSATVGCAPMMIKGNGVVMDNVPAYKVDGVNEAIEGQGCDAALSAALSIRSRWTTTRSRRSYANAPNAPKKSLPGEPDNSWEDLKLKPVPTSPLTPEMQYDRNPF